MRWLRRLIRRNMKPMHEYDAMKWKQRVALFYAFVTWNALGLVAYKIYDNKNDWAAYYGLKLEDETNIRPGVYWAEFFGDKKATIYKVEGFRVVEKVDYVAPEEDS